MKIALGIFKYFPCGGLQVDMRNIALELASRGEQVTIFTGAWEDSEFPENVEVKVLPLCGRTNHAKALDFAKKFHAAAADADVKFAFNRFGGCDFYFAADDCFAAALKKKKNGFLLRLLDRYRTFAKLEQEIFSPVSSTTIFNITEKQKEDFQTFYGTPDERFIYLGPGVGKQFCLPSAERREECRKALGIAEDETLALFVAANWKLKGGDRVLDAFAALPEDIRSCTRLCFTGGDGNGEAQSLAQKKGLADRCIFAGVRKDTLCYYHAADVLVHPARKEATGGVIAESLACGVPVLVSGLCGYSSLIAESGAGIVLPEPFVSLDLTDAWCSWYGSREQFAEKAVLAARTLKLKSRAEDAASAILMKK